MNFTQFGPNTAIVATGLVVLALAIWVIVRTLKRYMTALENLTQAVTDLTASVDRAVIEIGTPHPTEAAVQAAADAVNAQTVRLTAAVDAAQGTTPTTPAP